VFSVSQCQEVGFVPETSLKTVTLLSDLSRACNVARVHEREPAVRGRSSRDSNASADAILALGAARYAVVRVCFLGPQARVTVHRCGVSACVLDATATTHACSSVDLVTDFRGRHTAGAGSSASERIRIPAACGGSA